MSWVNVGVAAVETGVSLYGANKSKQDAGKAARMNGPHGVSGDFGNSTVDSNGNMTFNLDPQSQQWADLAQKLGMGQLGSFKSNPLDALTGQQSSTGANLDSILSHNQDQYGSQADSLFKALQGLGSDPQGIAQNRYDLLTKQAAPGESLARNSLQTKQFAQGRLGTSGGALDTKALYDSQGNADLSRQVAGQDLGMNWQNQLSQMFQQFSGLHQSTGAARFGLANELVNQGRTANNYALDSSAGMDSLYQQMFAPMFQAQQLNKPMSADAAAMMGKASQNQNDALMGAVGTMAKAYMG